MRTESIMIGPCAIQFGEVDLGLTKGGVQIDVVVSASPSNEILLPRHYDHIVDEMDVSVTVSLVETHNGNLAIAFPWGAENGGTLSVADGSGKGLRQYARPLTVTPMDGVSDLVVLPMAAPISQISGATNYNSERVITIKFQALSASGTDSTLIQFSAR